MAPNEPADIAAADTPAGDTLAAEIPAVEIPAVEIPAECLPVDAAPLFRDHMPILSVPPDGPGEDGCFVITTEFTAPHLNRAGSVHGGIIACMLDVAVAGGAGRAHGDVEKWFGVTLTLTVNYIAAAQPGPARAVARSLGGNRTKTMHATLFDSTGTLVASAQGTVKVIPRSEI